MKKNINSQVSVTDLKNQIERLEAEVCKLHEKVAEGKGGIDLHTCILALWLFGQTALVVAVLLLMGS